MLWCGCCRFLKWRFNSTGLHSHLQSIRFTATPYFHGMCHHDKAHCRHLGVSYLWPAVSERWGEGIPRSCDPASTTWVMTIFLGCEWLAWRWRLKNNGSSTLRLVFEEDKWVMWYETLGLQIAMVSMSAWAHGVLQRDAERFLVHHLLKCSHQWVFVTHQLATICTQKHWKRWHFFSHMFMTYWPAIIHRIYSKQHICLNYDPWKHAQSGKTL